jgi:surface protein
LENERVLSSWCVACGAGKYNGPGDDPSLGVTPSATDLGQCRAEDRGGQLPRRRSHRRGVLQSRRGLRRRGDCRDAGLGRVAGDGHEQLFYNKGSFNADISRWDTSSVTTMHQMFRERQGVQPGYRYMGHLERHDHARCSTTPTRSTSTYRDGTSARSRPCSVHVLRRQRIQQDAGGLGHIQSHGFSTWGIFYSADAWNARFEGGDTVPSPAAGGRARTTRATRPLRPSTAPSAPAPTPS